MNLLVDYYTEVQFRPYGGGKLLSSGACLRDTVPRFKIHGCAAISLV